MNFIRKIINTGTAKQPSSEIPRIRLVNGIILFSIFLVVLYIVSYLTIFPSASAAWINVGVVAALLLCFPLSAAGYIILSRIWFGAVFLIQFFVLTFFIFSKESGIHLFFICIAPVSFLLFDFNNRLQRFVIYAFSAVSILLFSYCQIYPDNGMLITRENLHYNVSVISLIVTLYVISVIFTREMNRAVSQLNILATTDELSGLLNRRSFFINGERILGESIRKSTPVALMLLDLDHFKNINDTYGHPAGDEMIRAFAETVKNTLRKNDIFARLGGEEFGIILPESDAEGAGRVAEGIRSVVENLTIAISQDSRISCTVSIGIALFNKQKHDFDTLLLNCDKALYDSKKSGRNRCSVFI